MVMTRADGLDLESVIEVLQVTHDEFPGVTFTGTAEEVYKQMVELDVNFFANLTTDEDAVTLKGRDLQARSVSCDWGSPILSWNNCVEGIGYLQDLGRRGARCGVNAAPACARVSCSHGCGMFLCNKVSFQLWGPFFFFQLFVLLSSPSQVL
jgi:hypothetical protein